MLEMIHKRRNAEKKEERYDLFSSLLDASEDETDGQTKLTDRELLGSHLLLFYNVYMSQTEINNRQYFYLPACGARGKEQILRQLYRNTSHSMYY